MKRFSFVFSLLASLLFAAPALAGWNADKDTSVEEGLGAKILIDFAENMPWIPDGADTGKYLYIIARADCPVSPQLYAASRKHIKDMQIR